MNLIAHLLLTNKSCSDLEYRVEYYIIIQKDAIVRRIWANNNRQFLYSESNELSDGKCIPFGIILSGHFLIFSVTI